MRLLVENIANLLRLYSTQLERMFTSAGSTTLYAKHTNSSRHKLRVAGELPEQPLSIDATYLARYHLN